LEREIAELIDEDHKSLKRVKEEEVSKKADVLTKARKGMRG
jgi:hypothetical protein